MERKADVLIAGGGIVGACIARELSRTSLTTILAERREDLARGASGANSGIIHAGYDPEPGSLMARYNVRGCAMYVKLAEDLGFPYRKIGSLVLSFDAKGDQTVRRLYEQGQKNGVPDLRILTGNQARSLEPKVSGEVTSALYAPSAGIVSPYEAVIAFSENAAVNGVQFLLRQPVTAIEKMTDGTFLVHTPDEVISARTVINCSGTAAGKISAMAGAEKIEIIERKGEYTLYDRNLGGLVHTVIFQTPDENGKGVLVTPTAEGNLLLGPSSEILSDSQRGDTATTQQGQDKIYAAGQRSVPELPRGGAITGFAGIRAMFGNDFLVCPSEIVPRFFQVAGICSPGLTSAPAIAEEVAQMVEACLESQGVRVRENPDFIPTREAVPSVRDLSWPDRAKLCQEDPDYGRIVCRCETVTEGQIRRVLRSPIPVYTLDGVKRRCRAGMGRCQGSFCTPRVMEIISEESGIPFEQICKAGKGTEIAQGRLKEGRRNL